MLHYLRMLLGRLAGGSGDVELRPGVYSSIAFDPADATAFFRLNSSGSVVGGEIDESSTGAYNWRLAGASADYDVRATMISGTLSGAFAAGTWYNLGSTVNYQKTRTILNSSSCTFLVEIRPAGGGPALASAQITLTATVEI